MDVVIKVLAAGRVGQDRADVFQQPNRTIIVLADGAGGTSGGAEAADAVLASVRASRPASITDSVSLLMQLDLDLENVGQTTAVLAIVLNGQIFGASVGDSCAWLVGSIDVLELTRNQKRKPLLGSGYAIPVGFGPVEVADSRVIVGSDGLFNYVPNNQIAGMVAISNLEIAAVTLVDAARLQSGALQDDIAVIIVDFNRALPRYYLHVKASPD